MKVKINKLIPYKENLSSKNPSEQKPITIGKQPYLMSTYRLDEKNYTGFKTHLQMICTLPDATFQYDYLKIKVGVENTQKKQLIQKVQHRFEDIKKNQNKREFVLQFLPTVKGSYTIRMESIYKPKFYSNPNNQHNNSTSDERKQNMQTVLKFEEPFEITENIVKSSQNQSSNNVSLTFPLLIQHTIQCKYPFDEAITFDVQFNTSLFKYNFLNDKNQFKLKNNQTYYTMLQVSPNNIKEFLSKKPSTIGELQIQYGQQYKGSYIKNVSFKSTDKYLLFKGETLLKSIPKKDIIQIPIKFGKIYNANFDLGDLSIEIINDLLDGGVKIIKASKKKINLDHKRNEEVIFSIICLKSGFYHIKALTLTTKDGRIVNYVNDITFFVENEVKEKEKKAAIFENTSVIEIGMDSDDNDDDVEGQKTQSTTVKKVQGEINNTATGQEEEESLI